MPKIRPVILALIVLLTLYMSVNAQDELSNSAVAKLDWSSMGYQAIGYWSGEIRVIDSSGQSIKMLNAESDVVSLTWSPDGTMLAYSNHIGGVWIWGSVNDQVIAIPQHDAYTDAVGWSPDGTQLGIVSRNGTGSAVSSQIQIWNINPLQLTTSIYIDFSAVASIAWNPTNNNQVAVGSVEGAVGVWDIPTGDRQQYLEVEAETLDTASLLIDIDWSRDGNTLAAASSAGTIWLWNTTTWQATVIFIGGGLTDIDWSVDGRLAIGSSESVRILDPFNPQAIQTYPSTDIVWAVAWSPDGTEFIAGGGHGTLEISSIAAAMPTLTPTHTPPPPATHNP